MDSRNALKTKQHLQQWAVSYENDGNSGSTFSVYLQKAGTHNEEYNVILWD